MPKILQRTLLTSIINFLIFSFFYYITCIIINIIAGNKLDIQEENLMFIAIIVSELYDNRIPDYIFIAPFSRAGRIKLQRKLFFYNLLARWIIISAFTIFPKIITGTGSDGFHNLGLYIFEITVIYLLLFITGHLRYSHLMNKINFTLTGVFIYIFALPASSFIFFLITEDIYNTSSYTFMAVMGILIAVISLYYYKKHFNNMLEFYSDYELITQIKM